MSASIELLHEVVNRLTQNGLDVWVFGGWAEELHGVIVPREHRDIDLLVRAADFLKVELLLESGHDFEEIEAKRFFHKRAFLYRGVMVELFLVEHDAKGWYTNFWQKVRFDWPSDTFMEGKAELPVVAASAVKAYRAIHDTVRYEDFGL